MSKLNQLADEAVAETGKRYARSMAALQKKKTVPEAITIVRLWQAEHLESYDLDGEPMDIDEFMAAINAIIAAVEESDPA